MNCGHPEAIHRDNAVQSEKVIVGFEKALSECPGFEHDDHDLVEEEHQRNAVSAEQDELLYRRPDEVHLHFDD
jgi:hypothetical protein